MALKFKAFCIKITMSQLLNLDFHLGHKRSMCSLLSSWSIYCYREGISILQLLHAVRFGRLSYHGGVHIGANNGLAFFVTQRKYFAVIVERAAISCGEPYKTGHWICGTLSNFKGIRLNTILRVPRLYKRADYSGLARLSRIPQMIYLSSFADSISLITESNITKASLVSMVDTEYEARHITYPFIGNDDSVVSVTYFYSFMSKSVLAGKAAGAARFLHVVVDSEDEGGDMLMSAYSKINYNRVFPEMKRMLQHINNVEHSRPFGQYYEMSQLGGWRRKHRSDGKFRSKRRIFRNNLRFYPHHFNAYFHDFRELIVLLFGVLVLRFLEVFDDDYKGGYASALELFNLRKYRRGLETEYYDFNDENWN